MKYLCVSLILSVILPIIWTNPNTQFWYTTEQNLMTTPNSTVDGYDFRGCFDSECIYISSSPLFPSDTFLAPYSPEIPLWAVSENGKSISWVFSQDRPNEGPTTSWITPVPSRHVPLSFFDPKPYLRADPDPLVAKLVSSISQQRIQNRVEQLSEDFFTRNSLSTDAVSAARFLQSLVTEFGCKNSRLHQFRTGYSPNVICELPGYDNSAPSVYVGAHYDSRSTGVNSPTQRAPGADDNGSGTAGVLDILISVVELINQGISFRRNIVFCLFAGEEQGLIGSGVFATQLVNEGIDIVGMVGLDMIGYPQPNSPNTLYWMSGSTNSQLTQLGISLTKTYLGESTLVTTTPACCSDQQSFFSRGYPAASVAESLAYSNNPNYHRATDTADTVSFRHVFRNTQSAAALVGTLAEPREPTTKKIME